MQNECNKDTLKNNIQEIFIFAGPPGSGKGTISSLFAKKFGWVQLSTGDLFRWHIANATELGKQIDNLTKSGKLVSDEIVVAMVQDWLTQQLHDDKVVILDGFPRTVAQAKALENFIQLQSNPTTLHIVELSASDDIIVQRLSTRLTCSNPKCQAIYSTLNGFVQGNQCSVCNAPLVRRSDDCEESIRRRLLEYHKHAQMLIDYFKCKKHWYIRVSATQPIENVFASVKERIIAKQ